MKRSLFTIILLTPLLALAQSKKPLDHTVYDSWQTIDSRMISHDGNFVVYTITPQEGDGKLVIQKTSGEVLAEVSRGYAARISNDSRYVVFKIKPWFKDTRDARIKKKKPEEMPQDSLAVVPLHDVSGMRRYAGVKSFKLPEEAAVPVAILFEKSQQAKPKDTSSVKKDSTRKEGTDLLLYNPAEQNEIRFQQVADYFFDKKGTRLLLKINPSDVDSTKGRVHLYDLQSRDTKIIFNRFNDAKGFAFSDDGKQLAFFAERDSLSKALQKFYKLWYYKDGMDSAKRIADEFTAGIRKGWAVSENSNIIFSKSGDRLLFGTAPVLPVRDTLTPEIDRVNVDIWSYKDDYLQPQQLKNRDTDEKRSYTAIFDWKDNRIIQLGNEWNNPVYVTMEGDGKHFYSTSDSGTRAAFQWQGYSLKRVFHINPETGKATMIHSDFKGNVYPSYTGKFLLMYDEKKKSYLVYNASSGTTTSVAGKIPYALYDEENDVPDDPNPYGIIKWLEDDKGVLIYDRYDIWKVDPENKHAPYCITLGAGRKSATQYRVLQTDTTEKFIKEDQLLWLRLYSERDKRSGLATIRVNGKTQPAILFSEPVLVNNVLKAKDNNTLAFSKETFQQSPDLYVMPPSNETALAVDLQKVSIARLTNINPQQQNYLWGSAELFKWTAYTGKQTEGILYKPENFDPRKKYPMIVYFYERNNQTLHQYLAPSPTPSRLNIPFFVSRGYVVFVPDIWYKTGYPGQSAYDYVVSGTRAVVKKGFVDSTKIGLQGQSWGGYQIAWMITRTGNLYAAAWAGAPVANMTSAYGGIRWGTGLNRQFQYEKTQSRIGATLWEKPNLYIENSPLFHLPKVKTPLVIMANDADDAVPWYQGIELFTGLRRLGKPVWMLNYNGEAHNLVQRKNRKDIQIREQQFFDWLLKNEKPARWLSEGVPAVLKGRDLGLTVE